MLCLSVIAFEKPCNTKQYPCVTKQRVAEGGDGGGGVDDEAAGQVGTRP